MASKRVKPRQPKTGRPVYVEDRDRPEPVKVEIIKRPATKKQPTMSERIAKADHNFM